MKHYYVERSLKADWNYSIKENDTFILLTMLFLVLIPTLILTTLETLKYKTTILYSYGFLLDDNNTKTNSYKWELTALDLLYESLLLRQRSDNNTFTSTMMMKVKTIITSDQAKQRTTSEYKD